MNRRNFMSAASAAGLGLTGRLGSAATAEGVAPLLKLIEDSPRERIPRELARLIRGGARYEQLLAAVSLAAVRNVQPYPDVGYKYHAVMVLRSIDAATRHLPAADRWLPIAFAADYFKETQAEERAASGWRLAPRAAPSSIREPQAALTALRGALDSWDREAADAAVVACARTAAMEEIFALLFPYAARDLRAIGHKAIAVANAHSLITLLGSTDAEPLLRSTVAALQNADAGPNPATHDLHADRAWRKNQEQLRDIPSSWKQGHEDAGARRELRGALYRGADEEAGATVVGFLRQGLSPEAIWQVLCATAAELVMLQPGIVQLHAQTSANALHYAYRVSSDERTQQLMLLQCAAFIAMFCRVSRSSAAELALTSLEAVPPEHTGGDAIAEITAELSAGRRRDAARKSLGYLQSGGEAEALIASARHHLAYQATEAHEYKFSEAVFDSYAHFADPDWRARFLSFGMAYFTAPAARPTPLVAEMKELLRS